jgi:uncharacterized damage-inducible protein DinB
MNTVLQYPIGRVQLLEYSDIVKDNCLKAIQGLPIQLDYAVENLNDTHLHTPYRDGGWTPNQIIHHLADSHMNAFIRFKLALHEEHPTVKPYDQNVWAETIDVKNVPCNVSITLIHALHRRWEALLQPLTKEDFMRSFYHPEQAREVKLWEVLQYYAWHGKHHAAQVSNCKP